VEDINKQQRGNERHRPNSFFNKMSDDDEPRKAKIPKVLKPKDREKRLIVILERASLETVKVTSSQKLSCLFFYHVFSI